MMAVTVAQEMAPPSHWIEEKLSLRRKSFPMLTPMTAAIN
jgi:hypothetical protein